MPRTRGFTLLELLVVISIIAALAVIGIPALKRGKDSVGRLVALSQMRQIGTALFSYAADQSGTLPGPLKSGQGARYVPGQSDQLASVLGPYLGVADPTQGAMLKIFLPPAFVRAVGMQNLAGANPFVMNISANANGQGFKPWGSEAPPVAEPMKLCAVPSSLWAFCDADQLNPLVIGQPWATRTPAVVVHGLSRLAFYFDGRVGPIDDAQLRNSGGGGPPPPPAPSAR